ncbi:hypothetical protein BH23PLA1_BH23PLA1_27440 [soil metagenome]
MRTARLRWALPTLGLFALASAALAAAPFQNEPKPARPDSSDFIKPKEVTLAATVEPAEAKAGETVTYKVHTRIEEPWHIYGFEEEELDDGPQLTNFDFFNTGGLEVVGNRWKADPEPVVKPDPNFGNIPVPIHDEEVTWSIELRVPPGTEPGDRTLQSQIFFMICTDTTCKAPTRISIEPVTLTVLEGGAAAPEGAPAGALVEPEPDEPTEPAEVAAAISSDVQVAIDEGFLAFILLSAGAGFLALIMPCVWPMVPITVNFFVKQGQAGKGSTTGLAVTYCLAIIATFTLIGLIASAVFGATAVQNIAVNPWINLAVASLFVLFGLMLLGVIEFGLPSGLINFLNRQGGQGGIIGVIFMALVLTVTSFTCTFPVVGALLVMAATGSYIYPVIGLLVFSTVLALPFFLLALSPGLLQKMPRGGDWMNAVKVVGGLVEIGAAFKFLNNAEIGFGTIPEDAWTNAPTTLAIWIVLCIVCGVYLLGMFRTDHDVDQPRVGAGRILTGSFFLFLALFLTPALFGNPPVSQIWNRLVVGLLPPDIESLKAQPAYVAGGDGTGGAGPAPVPASNAPQDLIAAARKVHGVPWGMSYEAALERARESGKPVLIDFTALVCTNCRQMEQGVMPRREVVALLQQFETVSLYTDKVPVRGLSRVDQEKYATINQEFQYNLAQDMTLPLYVVVRPGEENDDKVEILGQRGGFIEAPVFAGFLQGTLDRYQEGNGGRVASVKDDADE